MVFDLPHLTLLQNNPDITEDTFGLLRAASGKARLLATQKMKQFEGLYPTPISYIFIYINIRSFAGLCHNNLNRSPEDAFPTTLDDLQGFWDMVYLQVTHVDTIFEDIEQLKRSDWQVNHLFITSEAFTSQVYICFAARY